MNWSQLALVHIGALITAAGGIFLKRLSVGLQPPEPTISWLISVGSNYYLWLGGFCYVFPIIIWVYLLKTIELTKLQPLLAVVYIYTVIFAIFFLGEQPSLQRLFGISLVVLGVFVVGRT